MCGIFGAVFQSAGREVDPVGALAVLRHRGPDSSGVFRSPGVTLGHTRLAILDLSPSGAQPMASADGRQKIVDYITVTPPAPPEPPAGPHN